jgi:hypothetical protein
MGRRGRVGWVSDGMLGPPQETAEEKPRELSEKEKMAQALFGGLGGGSSGTSVGGGLTGGQGSSAKPGFSKGAGGVWSKPTPSRGAPAVPAMPKPEAPGGMHAGSTGTSGESTNFAVQDIGWAKEPRARSNAGSLPANPPAMDLLDLNLDAAMAPAPVKPSPATPQNAARASPIPGSDLLNMGLGMDPFAPGIQVGQFRMPR